MATKSFDSDYFEVTSTYAKYPDVEAAARSLAKWNQEILRLVRRVEGRRTVLKGPALDVGCGHGASLGLLSDAGLEVVGTDISAWLLARVREARPQLRLGASDAGALPFRDGAFATVLCFEVLEHLEEPRIALTEFMRVLRPGGFLVATSPNPKGDRIPLFDSAADPTHISVLPPPAWQRLLSMAGFEDVRVVPYLQPPALWRIPGLRSPALRLPRIGPGTLLTGWRPVQRGEVTPTAECPPS